jgi:hypothetical protein
MAVITTGSFSKALWPGINAWYGQAYNEHKVEYTDLFDTHTSRKAWEEDVGYSGFGLAIQKTEGNAVSYDSERQGFVSRYTHATYALGFIITREMVEDDLYDVAGQKKAKGLAFSMRQTKEILGANVFNRAFSSTYTGGDGKELCATDHPNIAGGTFANELATAADLSEASLEQACIDLMKLENDRGLKISIMPKTLIVPVDLAFEADKILRTEYEVGTANNTVNVVRSKFPGGVRINHYLTDTDAWFIRTNAPDGMKYFSRRDDAFDMDDDFDTDNAKYKASFRCSFGWSDPRGVFGSPGA